MFFFFINLLKGSQKSLTVNLWTHVGCTIQTDVVIGSIVGRFSFQSEHNYLNRILFLIACVSAPWGHMTPAAERVSVIGRKSGCAEAMTWGCRWPSRRARGRSRSPRRCGSNMAAAPISAPLFLAFNASTLMRVDSVSVDVCCFDRVLWWSWVPWIRGGLLLRLPLSGPPVPRPHPWCLPPGYPFRGARLPRTHGGLRLPHPPLARTPGAGEPLRPR